MYPSSKDASPLSAVGCPEFLQVFSAKGSGPRARPDRLGSGELVPFNDSSGRTVETMGYPWITHREKRESFTSVGRSTSSPYSLLSP